MICATGAEVQSAAAAEMEVPKPKIKTFAPS